MYFFRKLSNLHKFISPPSTQEAQKGGKPQLTPMAASSSFLAAGRRLIRLGCGRLLPAGHARSHGSTPALIRAAAAASSPASPRGHSGGRKPARPPSLQSTLWPLGHPGTLLVPEIERWAAKPGNRLRHVELERIVKELRKRRRHRQALEVTPPLPPAPPPPPVARTSAQLIISRLLRGVRCRCGLNRCLVS